MRSISIIESNQLQSAENIYQHVTQRLLSSQIPGDNT